MKNFSVLMTEDLHGKLCNHLIRGDMQEDLCFATYVPSSGSNRFNGILSEIILPLEGDRSVHGNVGFLPEYFERAIQIAVSRKEGIAFIHSHPGPGWQGMSRDDIICESRIAPAVLAASDLPLLGCTVGSDGSWSARFWEKELGVKRKYLRRWCESVRIIGKKLSITFNDDLLRPSYHNERQLRTISAWGQKTQKDLSRLKVGIVGLGSVGSIVAEILARIGISHFTLIDFDAVEEKNLDRLMNVKQEDVGLPKVTAIRDAIITSSSSPNVHIDCIEYSICEESGYRSALDCDVLFSCVDRPWPRQVLNYIAYFHLIPVIDGGIMVRTNKTNTKIIGADWKAQMAGYKKPCLECLGQYKTENATLERTGLLDDPHYIQGIDQTKLIDANENVFVFSTHLASLEVLQMLSLFINPSGISFVGQQTHHFVTGTLDIESNQVCHENCYFKSIVGRGDYSGIQVYGKHAVAEKARQSRTVNSPT